MADEVSEHPKWAQDEDICPCGEKAGPDFRYGLCDKHAKETPAPTLLRMGATTGALAKEQARAEKAEGDRDFWRQRYSAAAKLSGEIESDLAAARRECEGLRTALGVAAENLCLEGPDHDALNSPPCGDPICTGCVARAALAAPAAGEGQSNG